MKRRSKTQFVVWLKVLNFETLLPGDTENYPQSMWAARCLKIKRLGVSKFNAFWKSVFLLLQTPFESLFFFVIVVANAFCVEF